MKLPDRGYADPVARLLTLGDPREMPVERNWLGTEVWVDYPSQYGLGEKNIPELIRMATDEELSQALSDSKEVWAPLHAWRALAQLRAGEAVKPLLTLLRRIDDDDDDWAGEDLPEALALIGQPAIRPASEYLANEQNKLWARAAASSALAKIGTAHPETREECVSALVAVLEKYKRNDEALNGELIAALIDLDASEAAPLVERAYIADRVDESIPGDWEDFQVEVGLLEERLTDPDEDLEVSNFQFPNFSEPRKLAPGEKKEKKKEKNRRKQAKASRKKNRKKK